MSSSPIQNASNIAVPVSNPNTSNNINLIDTTTVDPSEDESLLTDQSNLAEPVTGDKLPTTDFSDELHSEPKNKISQDEEFKEVSKEAIFEEKKNGQLFIACHPWANIFIDGTFIETTPLLHPIPLPEGTHLIELENPNFKHFSREIRIVSDSTHTLNIALEPAIGYLSVQVIPWGNIHVNNQYLETTPLSEPLALSAGKHKIRITNPNFSEITDSIFIEAGETVEKVFYFNP